jgi:hypothetical protein
VSNARSPERLATVWWLNPLFAFPAIVVPLAIATYRTPEQLFVLEWKCRKYFGWEDLIQVLTVLLIFCTASAVVQMLPRHDSDRRIEYPAAYDAVLSCFDLGVFLTVAGYIIWTTVAFARGFRPSLLKEILTLDAGAIYQVKQVYFKTVSGITTATQFGMACALIGTWLGQVTGSRKVKRKVVLLIVLATLRSLFLAERLALIELALPCIVLKCHFAISESGPGSARRRWIALFPIVAVPVLLVFFAVNEYFRSWGTWYQYQTQMTLLEFSAVRLTGYYVTAINNATVYHRVLGVLAAPMFTFDWWWNFPGVSSLVDMSPVVHTAMQYGYALTQFANPEMNNVSGLLTPLLDFGSSGAAIYWALAGAVASMLYRSFSEGQITGLIFYPFFYVGLMEVARSPYWSTGRAFPSWALLGLSLFLITDARSRLVEDRLGISQLSPLASN